MKLNHNYLCALNRKKGIHFSKNIEIFQTTEVPSTQGSTVILIQMSAREKVWSNAFLLVVWLTSVTYYMILTHDSQRFMTYQFYNLNNTS